MQDSQEPIDVSVGITPEAMAAAEAMAADDAALLEALKSKRKEASALVLDTVAEAEAAADHAKAHVRVPMNRAERRAQVKQYARILAETNRQVPVANPTIIPRSKRRRRPGQHGRLQHAH